MDKVMLLLIVVLALTTPANATQPALPTPAADRVVVPSPEEATFKANVATPEWILAPKCRPTVTPTPPPNGDPLDPATLSAGAPFVWPDQDGKPQTIYPYILNGSGELGARLWVDTNTVAAVVGWMAWGYGENSNGTFLDLLSIQMPDSGQYAFNVVHRGDLLAHTGTVRWELVGAQATGSTIGVAAAPRALPIVGRLYLPLMLRRGSTR